MRVPARLCSDAELVRAVRDGSDDAFAEIARRHAPLLRRRCARVVGAHRADDALQETLERALNALRRPGDTRAIELEPWLSRIARNAAIDHLRRSAPPWAELDERIDGVPRPPDVAAQREELRRALDGLHELPERQRRALALRAFEGRSWEEIAADLDVGEPAVRQLLHRARARLRAGAAALLLPFGIVRTGSARAAGLFAGGGAKLAAGGAVVTLVAGAAAVHPAGPVRHLTPPPAVAAKPTGHGTATGGGTSGARTPAAAHRAARHAARRAGAHRPRPVGRRTAPEPARAPAPRHPAAPHTPAPAAAPPTAAPPAATPAPGPASTAPATSPAPAVSPAPRTDPPPQAAAAPPAPPPSAAPAGPPPPPVTGHVTSWVKNAGYGGMLAVEPSAGGGAVTAFLGELTDLSCVRVRDGAVVETVACTPAAIVPGAAVSVFQTGVNATSGQTVWTRVQLVLPG